MAGGTTVLVVDDNPGDRKFIKESLQASQLDVTVYTVATKDEALDAVSHQSESDTAPRPDVLLLDWSLSYETSEEVVDAAKSGEPPILVVVMTGSNPERSDLKSSVSRADLFIEKPTDPEGYVESLRSLLSSQ
ncbi:response regulator [Halomicrobium urmianum]|uniref:response regulator n=1 Tax=Halomicrobium urmianum TaxID=1586233 RepID=UPI001CDA0BF5|nr:response regulator [Halomicrobium urmianum]